MAKELWTCGHPRDLEHSYVKADGSLKQCKVCAQAARTRRMRELGVPERQPTPRTFPCGHERADHGKPRSDKRYLYCYTCALAKKRAEKDAMRAAKGRVKRGDPAVFPCGHPRSPDNTRVAGTCRICANAGQALRAKEWRRANPEEAKAQAAAVYRARKIARGDRDTLAWLDLIRRDPCSYCGDLTETVDHIEPKVRGGENHWTNYAPACRSCNSSKSDQSLLLYLLRRRGPTWSSPAPPPRVSTPAS